MKTEATVTKSAVPSMLTVAPMGTTNLEIRLSTPTLFRLCSTIGRAVALEIRENISLSLLTSNLTYVDAVAKAVIQA